MMCADTLTTTVNPGLCFSCSMEGNDVEDEIEDLLSYFEQELTLESAFPKICTPELDLTQMHISGHCT